MTQKILLLPVAAAMLALVVGCGGGGGGGDETSQVSPKRDRPTPAVPAEEPPATTTPLPSTTLPPQNESPAPDYEQLAAGPNLEDSGPSGAGCAPGGGSTLPDGWWAGSITQVEGKTVELDVVCWFAEPATPQAMREDGVEYDTHPYYLRNNNPRTYNATFASETGPARLAPVDLTNGGDRTAPATIADVLQMFGEPSGDSTLRTPNGEFQVQDTIWLHMSGGVADYAYMSWSC